MREYFILLLSLYLITAISCSTGGVQPYEQTTNIPYIQTQLITLSSETFGLISFANESSAFRTTTSLSRQFDNIIQHNLVTVGLSGKSHGIVGYRVNSTIVDNGSGVQVQLSVIEDYELTRISFNLIVLMGPVQARYPYITLFEQQLKQNVVQYIYPYEIQNCQIYPLIKSMNIKQFLQSKDGGIRLSSKFGLINDNLELYKMELINDNENNSDYNNSVTYVILIINTRLIKESSAQLNNLQIISTRKSTQSSHNNIIEIEQYNSQLFKSNIILGISQLTSLSIKQSNFGFNLYQKNKVNFKSNQNHNIFNYTLLTFKDKLCPETHPYKFKNDNLCYPCPQQRIINITNNNNNTFTQHKSILNNNYKINTNLTGYSFNLQGKISSICAYFKECQQGQYLNQGVCQLCLNQISNCQTCSSINDCTKCKVEYQLIQENGNSVCQKIRVQIEEIIDQKISDIEGEQSHNQKISTDLEQVIKLKQTGVFDKISEILRYLSNTLWGEQQAQNIEKQNLTEERVK